MRSENEYPDHGRLQAHRFQPWFLFVVDPTRHLLPGHLGNLRHCKEPNRFTLRRKINVDAQSQVFRPPCNIDTLGHHRYAQAKRRRTPTATLSARPSQEDSDDSLGQANSNCVKAISGVLANHAKIKSPTIFVVERSFSCNPICDRLGVTQETLNDKSLTG